MSSPVRGQRTDALHPHDLAGCNINLGLVIQNQSVLGDRLAQLTQEIQRRRL